MPLQEKKRGMIGKTTFITNTAMLQKTISMTYFIFGISLLSVLISAQSCSTVEYRADAKYVYINDTASTIEVKGRHSFVLNPQEEYAFQHVVDGAKENMTPNDFIPPFGDYAVVISNNKCDTLQPLYPYKGVKEGLLGIENYTSEKLGHNNFKFTYHFTEEDFVDAKPCE